MTRRTALALTLLVLAPAGQLVADDSVGALLPLKPEVRRVLNESCVMCHGEVIDGEKETRDDIDLSTDEDLKLTLPSAGKLKQVLLEDKMPHKPRLSRRLRNDPQYQQRLAALRAKYDADGHKAILLDWLKDVVATTSDKKE